MRPPLHTVPGNDYRGILRSSEVAGIRLTVVVPVRDRLELLARTLGGLAAELAGRDDVDVVVSDDGSSGDVAQVVEASGLDARLVLPDDGGTGAGGARNRGAAGASGDVLLFLDADCIPAPGLVDRHLRWHRRAANVVVVGPRRAVDSSELEPGELAAGSVDLHGLVDVDPADRLVAPDDWRALVYRRSRRLLLGTEGFRAATTANLSVPRWVFEHVGGFDEGFRTWGGEDTELAWRLWNEGCYVVPEDGALALHQVQLDEVDRGDARRRSVGAVADRVPANFYRPRPTPLSVVPKVSWLVAVHTAEDLALAEQWVAEATPADVELVLHGPPDVLGHLVEVDGRNPRRRVVADADPARAAAGAVDVSRGEYLALVDARVRVPGVRVARGVRDLEADPSPVVARTSYVVEGDRYLRLDDLRAVDAELSPSGLPMLAVARRSEVARRLHATGAVDTAWEGVCDGPTSLSVTDPVEVAGPVARTPRPPDLSTAAAVGAREIVRAAVRGARRRAASPDAAPRDTDSGPGDSDDLVGVEYVGLTGKQNLGDDAVRLAVERLMPWANVGIDVPAPRLLVVGGGTLLNGRRYYLTRMLRQDSPVLERALFGTGVRNPDYWGVTEPMEEWFSFIDHAVHASVRGPASVENLARLGYEGTVDIIGDPAFSLRPSEAVEHVDGRVVVCPVWTEGNLHGGDDTPVFEALAGTIRRLRAEGRDVVMLSAFPQDDRWIIELMRRAGAPDMPYVAGYESVDDTMDLLAGADLVVGERLHAAILAASAGTPFVALEYRPKVRDFALSVDQEDAVVRTDEMHRLDDVVDTVLAEAQLRRGIVLEAVTRYRDLQQASAQGLRQSIAGG